jgi:hypothetical protein
VPLKQDNNSMAWAQGNGSNVSVNASYPYQEAPNAYEGSRHGDVGSPSGEFDPYQHNSSRTHLASGGRY